MGSLPHLSSSRDKVFTTTEEWPRSHRQGRAERSSSSCPSEMSSHREESGSLSSESHPVGSFLHKQRVAVKTMLKLAEKASRKGDHTNALNFLMLGSKIRESPPRRPASSNGHVAHAQPSLSNRPTRSTSSADGVCTDPWSHRATCKSQRLSGEVVEQMNPSGSRHYSSSHSASLHLLSDAVQEHTKTKRRRRVEEDEDGVFGLRTLLRMAATDNVKRDRRGGSVHASKGKVLARGVARRHGLMHEVTNGDVYSKAASRCVAGAALRGGAHLATDSLDCEEDWWKGAGAGGSCFVGPPNQPLPLDCEKGRGRSKTRSDPQCWSETTSGSSCSSTHASVYGSASWSSTHAISADTFSNDEACAAGSVSDGSESCDTPFSFESHISTPRPHFDTSQRHRSPHRDSAYTPPPAGPPLRDVSTGGITRLTPKGGDNTQKTVDQSRSLSPLLAGAIADAIIYGADVGAALRLKDKSLAVSSQGQRHLDMSRHRNVEKVQASNPIIVQGIVLDSSQVIISHAQPTVSRTGESSSFNPADAWQNQLGGREIGGKASIPSGSGESMFGRGRDAEETSEGRDGGNTKDERQLGGDSSRQEVDGNGLPRTARSPRTGTLGESNFLYEPSDGPDLLQEPDRKSESWQDSHFVEESKTDLVYKPRADKSSVVTKSTNALPSAGLLKLPLGEIGLQRPQGVQERVAVTRPSLVRASASSHGTDASTCDLQPLSPSLFCMPDMDTSTRDKGVMHMPFKGVMHMPFPAPLSPSLAYAMADALIVTSSSASSCASMRRNLHECEAPAAESQRSPERTMLPSLGRTRDEEGVTRREVPSEAETCRVERQTRLPHAPLAGVEKGNTSSSLDPEVNEKDESRVEMLQTTGMMQSVGMAMNGSAARHDEGVVQQGKHADADKKAEKDKSAAAVACLARAMRCALARRRMQQQIMQRRHAREQFLAVARGQAAIILQCAVRASRARKYMAKHTHGAASAEKLTKVVLKIFADLSLCPEREGEANQHVHPSVAESPTEREVRIHGNSLWHEGSSLTSGPGAFLVRACSRAATVLQSVARGHRARVEAQRLAAFAVLEGHMLRMLVHARHRHLSATVQTLQRAARYALAAMTPALSIVHLRSHSYLLYTPAVAWHGRDRQSGLGSYRMASDSSAPEHSSAEIGHGICGRHLRAGDAWENTSTGNRADTSVSPREMALTTIRERWRMLNMQHRMQHDVERSIDVESMAAGMSGPFSRGHALQVDEERQNMELRACRSVVWEYLEHSSCESVVSPPAAKAAPANGTARSVRAWLQDKLAHKRERACEAAARTLQRVLRGHAGRLRAVVEAQRQCAARLQKVWEEERMVATRALQAQYRRKRAAEAMGPVWRERREAARRLALYVQRWLDINRYVQMWMEGDDSEGGGAGSQTRACVWIQGSVVRSLEQLDGRLKTFLGPASAAETTWQDQVGSGHRKPEPTRYPTRYPGFFSSSSPDPGACSARAQNDSSVLGAALLHSGDGSMSRTWLPWRHGQEWDLLSAQPPLSLSLLTSAASAQPQEPRADGGWRDGPRAGASASLLTTGNGLAPLRLATVWRNGVAPSVLSPVADRSCVLIHEFVNATERAAITMQRIVRHQLARERFLHVLHVMAAVRLQRMIRGHSARRRLRHPLPPSNKHSHQDIQSRSHARVPPPQLPQGHDPLQKSFPVPPGYGVITEKGDGVGSWARALWAPG